MAPSPGFDGLRPRRRSGREPARRRDEAGISLVELVVVITITGILAGVVGAFMAAPVQGFFDQARRADLVDGAQLAMIRMGRDLRAALPNSIRVADAGRAVELLLTLDGDRYRTEAPGSAAERLDFATTDAAFNTFAPLYPPDSVPPLGNSYRVKGSLAIYPLRQDGADPYADETMTPPGNIDITTVTGPGGGVEVEYRVTLDTAPSPVGAHQFRFDSPSRRVYLVQGPVTYRCSGGQLLRYEGYSVSTSQPVPPSGPALVTTVITGNVQTCAFSYTPGVAQRSGVVSVALTLADADELAETVSLLRQIHVSNAP